MRRFIFRVCGMVLLAGILSSCSKEYKVTVYQLYCDMTEFTQPQTIKDPEVQSLYIGLWTDLSNLNLNDTWQVEVINDKFSAEDSKAEARYDSNLPKVKELESSYKKKIEELGGRSESSFYTKIVYKLSKSVPADYSSECLREYYFELKYD